MDTAAEEKRQIQENQPPDLFRREKTLFLISTAWWKAWTAYVCYDNQDSPAPRPGPIDNSALLTQPWTPSGWLTTALRSDLLEHLDFEYLTNISWRKLLHWYRGEPAVEVFVVNGEPDHSPVAMKVWVIETQVDYDKPKETVLVSRKVKVGQIHKYLCDRLSLPYHKYTISIDSHSNPDKLAFLEDLSTSSPINTYIRLASMPLLLPVQISAAPRNWPSSHSDTQDDSDPDMDVFRGLQRTDRKEVAARIAATRRDVRLTIQDIAVTEKGLKVLWQEESEKSAR